MNITFCINVPCDSVDGAEEDVELTGIDRLRVRGEYVGEDLIQSGRDEKRERALRKWMCWYATRVGQKKPNHPLFDGVTGSVNTSDDSGIPDGSAGDGLSMNNSSYARLAASRT